MNFKTSSAYLLIIIFVASQLTSCATGSPTPDIIISTPTSQPSPTTTPEPSATPSPQPTETKPPIQTPTPKVPPVKIADFKNFSPDRFFPVTHESRLQLNNDIASGINSVLPSDISAVKPIAFVVAKYVDGMTLELNCKININCATRYAVNDNGVNMIIWEMIIKDPDGNNMRVAFTTAPVPQLEESPYIDYAQQVIHRLGEKLTEVNLVLPLQDDTQKHSQVVNDLLNPTIIRLKLRDGIIDENTADEAVWLTNLSGY